MLPSLFVSSTLWWCLHTHAKEEFTIKLLSLSINPDNYKKNLLRGNALLMTKSCTIRVCSGHNHVIICVSQYPL